MKDDPAARLHEILMAWKATAVGQGIVEDGWVQVLRLPEQAEDDLPVFLECVAGVAALPSIIERRIGELDNVNVELLLRWVPSVRDALAWGRRFDQQWGEVTNRIKDDALYGLELCSDALQRQQPREMPSDDDVQALIEEVQQLMASITKSSLTVEAKEALLSPCRELVVALQRIKIYGAEGVTPLVERAIGAVLVHSEVREAASTSPEVRSLIERFWAVMDHAASLSSIGAGGTAIVVEVLKALH